MSHQIAGRRGDYACAVTPIQPMPPRGDSPKCFPPIDTDRCGKPFAVACRTVGVGRAHDSRICQASRNARLSKRTALNFSLCAGVIDSDLNSSPFVIWLGIIRLNLDQSVSVGLTFRDDPKADALVGALARHMPVGGASGGYITVPRVPKNVILIDYHPAGLSVNDWRRKCFRWGQNAERRPRPHPRRAIGHLVDGGRSRAPPLAGRGGSVNRRQYFDVSFCSRRTDD
ncbi:hypothetical protein EVAR_85256_1 [Eumeta japonica]|uniref:Uncharacterized protein n=1 Tax=Eumeta variegata TaxID=151549 RepID=A0A4C1W0L6_EUMVA|nr:hypothetical protein EVAR_85256_1 [Eumeta japonica]